MTAKAKERSKNRRAHIQKYRGTDRRALWEVGTTLFVQVTLYTAHDHMLRALWIGIQALVIVRWFILFHDAGHGNVARSCTLNRIVLYVCSIMCATPVDWTARHRLHHASNGNLTNTVLKGGHAFDFNETTLGLTKAQFDKWPRWKQRGFRVVRWPWIFFMVVPFVQWYVKWRIPVRFPTQKPYDAMQRNLNTAMVLALWYASGLNWDIWWAHYFGAVFGTMLFHAQHTFENGYARCDQEWSFEEAAFRGSSFICVPRLFKWFTMGIEYHHIHHYDTKVPGYLMQACHDDAPSSFWTEVTTLNYGDWGRVLCTTMYDEETRKYV